jgi:hypothetical protein
LNLYNLIPATALIPWIGWAFWGGLQQMRVRRTLLLGFLLALQIIAFEPLLFQCCALLILALSVLYLLDQDDKRHAIQVVVAVVSGAALFAAGLAAVQILPTLELLPLSARGAGIDYSVASGWSMHPLDLVNALVPNFYGYLYTIGATSSWGEAYHELRNGGYLVSFFVGSVVLLLAALGCFSARANLRKVLTVAAVLTVVLALGKFTAVYPFLYRYAPFFNLGRYPSKYFILTTLLISMLAALGLEASLQRSRARRRGRNVEWSIIIAIITAVAILGLGLVWSSNVETLAALIRSATPIHLLHTKDFNVIASHLARSVVSSGAFLMIGGFILLAGRKLKRTALFGFAIVFLIGVELMPPNLGLSPLISDVDVDYVPELTMTMKDRGPSEPFRTVTPNYLNPTPTEMVLKAPNRAAAWVVLFYRRSGQSLDGIRKGLQYAIDRSVDYLNSRESDALMQRSLDLPAAGKLALLANLNCPMVPTIGELPDPRVTQLGAIETHSNLDYRLYRLSGVLPRAYIATRVIPAASQQEALDRLLEAKSALSGTVILESPQHGPTGAAPADPGPVSVTRYENNRVACTVTARSAGFLVLLDSWYPGWKAYMDGREVEVLRANYAFRAVAVAPGTHQVEFLFAPRSFHVGAAITCTTLLTGMAAAVFAALRRRRSAATGSQNGADTTSV